MSPDRLKKLIYDEYDKIDRNQPSTEADILYNIIELKVNKNFRNVGQSLYLDVKQLIIAVFNEVEIADYGYDQVPMEQLERVLGYLPKEQQRELYLLIYRKYAQAGYEDYEIRKKVYSLSNQIDINNRNYVRLALRFLSSKDCFLLLFCIMYILVIFAMLHPAPCEWLGVLDINLHEFADNDSTNYWLNTFAYIWGDNDYAPVLKPTSLYAMVLVGIGKLIVYVFIGNFVINKILEYIDLKR